MTDAGKMYLSGGKKADPKDYIFYGSICMAFWEGRMTGMENRAMVTRVGGEEGG